MMIKTTVDTEEIEKFNKSSEKWWDETGEYSLLHKMNPVRIEYIKECAALYLQHINHTLYYNQYKTPANTYIDIINSCQIIETEARSCAYLPLNGYRILDIGCGGGILSIPLKRLGGEIVGIDAGIDNIKAALLHAQNMKIAIDYINTTSEELAKSQKHTGSYDIVLCMEVIEHVADFKLILDSVAKLLKGGGIFILSTISRTLNSFVKAIFFAEYALNIVPHGTHSWKKFLKPSEIVQHLETRGFSLRDIKGLEFSILTQSWRSTNGVNTNYILCMQKA